MPLAAYYSEFEPTAAAWLRELIAAGEITPGAVDDRDIRDVAADDVRGFTRCHFFSGIAGWELALRLAGWPADLPVWTGSCPCQPFSSAGKRKGHADERHLWPEMFRLVRGVRPPVVFGEQVASAIGHGWFDGIRGDLEREGYAVWGAVLGAFSAGSPHIRQRLFWVADRLADASNARHLRSEVVGADRGNEGKGQSANCRRAAGVLEPKRSGPTRRLADPDAGGRSDTGGGRNATGRGLVDDNCGPRRLGDTVGDNMGRHPGAALGAEGGGERGRSLDGDGGVQPGRTGAARRVGDSDGGVARHRGLQPGGEHGQQSADGGVGVALGDAVSAGLPRGEREAVLGAGRRGEGRAVGEPGGSFWSDCDLIPCRDGRYRRVPRGVEPGVLAVADGLSAAVAGGGLAGRDYHPLAQGKVEGRVGVLRGAGNAIVPQTAALFIRAWMVERGIIE